MFQYLSSICSEEEEEGKKTFIYYYDEMFAQCVVLSSSSSSSSLSSSWFFNKYHYIYIAHSILYKCHSIWEYYYYTIYRACDIVLMYEFWTWIFILRTIFNIWMNEWMYINTRNRWHSLDFSADCFYVCACVFLRLCRFPSNVSFESHFLVLVFLFVCSFVFGIYHKILLTIIINQLV